MTDKTESIEHIGISWHILAFLGIMKVKPGASEQLGWS